MSQSLLPAARGGGRVLAAEVLIPNSAIRNLMREDKVHQIPSLMQSGQAEHGMQTFNQGLARLVLRGRITREAAIEASSDAKELIPMIERAEASAGGRRRGRPVGRAR
jgi:twitching motility protein PilT